jgi:hypothetical protein
MAAHDSPVGSLPKESKGIQCVRHLCLWLDNVQLIQFGSTLCPTETSRRPQAMSVIWPQMGFIPSYISPWPPVENREGGRDDRYSISGGSIGANLGTRHISSSYTSKQDVSTGLGCDGGMSCPLSDAAMGMGGKMLRGGTY